MDDLLIMQESLSERMKRYEESTANSLPQKCWALIRVDGKSFSSYTKNFSKPFDNDIVYAMDAAAKKLLTSIQGAHLAYTQSDEISVLISNVAATDTQLWFNGKVQKIVSVSASIATAEFNATISREQLALFDARVFHITYDDIPNYFVWRARDAFRNSVQSCAVQFFSPKQLFEKNVQQQIDMMREAANFDYFKAVMPRCQCGNIFCYEKTTVIPDDEDIFVRKKIVEKAAPPNNYEEWLKIIKKTQ